MKSGPSKTKSPDTFFRKKMGIEVLNQDQIIKINICTAHVDPLQWTGSGTNHMNLLNKLINNNPKLTTSPHAGLSPCRFLLLDLISCRRNYINFTAMQH